MPGLFPISVSLGPLERFLSICCYSRAYLRYRVCGESEAALDPLRALLCFVKAVYEKHFVGWVFEMVRAGFVASCGSRGYISWTVFETCVRCGAEGSTGIVIEVEVGGERFLMANKLALQTRLHASFSLLVVFP